MRSLSAQIRGLVSKSSRIPGFYRLDVEARRHKLAEFGVDPKLFEIPGGLALDRAQHMVENCVGTYALPIGVATNFVMNGRELLVPMAIEEPSVIAAASAGALAARRGGGFRTSSTERRMIGQIQVVDCADFDRAKVALESARAALALRADALAPRMVERGGGARSVEIRDLGQETGPHGRMLVVQLVIDTVDAMGANVINTVVEGLGPEVERISGGRVVLRILSNYVDQCLARAEVRIPPEALADAAEDGAAIIEGILSAQRFAALDPYRAVTHNKGVMNGVDAVVIATGNDWRAIEAGAHAYAARKGSYGPMTDWRRDGRDLVGAIELPMPVGLIGGSIRIHPLAEAAIQLLGVTTARALAEVIVMVGLAQNFSAIRALATEGIQRGHMALHARTVAATAGARGAEVDRIAEALVALGDIRVERAKELLAGGA
ncbi:MAG: hydroxymethylglutaryl-CoA reductase, degradative [Myxococcota bacterium]